MKIGKYILVILAIFILAACADHHTPEAYSDPYGFFSGLWHGFIFLFSLIGIVISWVFSLVDIHVLENVQIIGRPNTGFLFYYVGFILGLIPGLTVLNGA